MEKPKFIGGYLISTIISICIIFLGLFQFINDVKLNGYNMFDGDGFFDYKGSGLVLIGVILIGITIYFYNRSMKRYKLYKTNKSEYYKMLQNESKRREEQRKASKKAEEERIALLPECPICKSKENVKRISTTDRTVSIALVGLASSKIGKQYECTKCKHKW